jgi:hypothetical protein
MAKLTTGPQAISQGLYEESSVQMMDLGAKVVENDGSEYRYVKAGALALVAGRLYDGSATVANHTNINVQAAAVAGATSVSVTLGATAATANQYADGWMIVNDFDGEGFTYRIVSHASNAGSGTLVLTLDPETPIVTAFTTNSQVTLIANQYNGVVIHAQSETGIPVGVAMKQITALYYGWIKTRGVVSVLSDGSPAAIGQGVSASTTTDGCVTLGTGALSPVGYALAQGVSTEENPVFLTIS